MTAVESTDGKYRDVRISFRTLHTLVFWSKRYANPPKVISGTSFVSVGFSILPFLDPLNHAFWERDGVTAWRCVDATVAIRDIRWGLKVWY